MGKRKQSTAAARYEHKIITDQGETIVKLVPSAAAKKIHKCLFCNTETDFHEEHVLLLPVAFSGNRRYGHKECYEAWRQYSSGMIKLHPGASNLAPGL